MNIAAFQQEPVEFDGFAVPASLIPKGTTAPGLIKRARDYAAVLENYASLSVSASVLDIGADFGSRAIAMMPAMGRSTTYLGLTASKKGAKWAQETITLRSSSFQFRSYQAKPGKSGGRIEVALPTADASHDLIAFVSFANRLFADDLVTYLRDCARVLRPGGRVVLALYILDAAIAEATHGRTGAIPSFDHTTGRGVFVSDPKDRNCPKAYSPRRFGSLARRARLVPIHFIRGSWSGNGKAQIDGPDVLILSKPVF